MSRRRSSRRGRAPSDRPVALSVLREQVEGKADGEWVVRRVTGSATGKQYLCPGCHQTIASVTPHTVAWPVVKSLLAAEAVDERRHWHSACWTRKH